MKFKFATLLISAAFLSNVAFAQSYDHFDLDSYNPSMNYDPLRVKQALDNNLISEDKVIEFVKLHQDERTKRIFRKLLK